MSNMLHRVLYILVLCVLCAIAQNTNSTLQEKNEQDVLVENWWGCTCILSTACNPTNVYSKAVQANTNIKTVPCSNPDYVCCPNAENGETKTITKPGCGIQKIKDDVPTQILTPEIESALTIRGEVPWIVQIFRQGTYKCIGTLIHPKVVLTIAHCIDKRNSKHWKVIATGGDIFQSIGSNPGNEKSVVEVIIHPEYNNTLLHNDIALLILQNDFSFDDKNKALNSICLPKSNTSFDGTRCIATGYGKKEEAANKPLRKVDLPIINFETCQKMIQKSHLGIKFKLHSSFICAGGETGKDTCAGDGGGPLMCLDDNFQFVQVGMVSWGLRANCGIANEPGMYVNLAKFTNWIEDQLQNRHILME